MCFDNSTASPPREVVKAAHIVANIEDCKNECWSSVGSLVVSRGTASFDIEP